MDLLQSLAPGSATLPIVRRWLRRGAIVLLDDALRDGELSTAALWSELGWLRVDGVILTEKGLLRARVTG